MLASERVEQLDKHNLVELYERMSPRLYRYAVRLLGDEDHAEECVSETFSRLLKAIQHGGGPRDNTQAYLYRAAHNWITDYYRRRPPEELVEERLPADPADGPGAVVARDQERQRVRTALMRLPAEQRMVMMLRFFEDLPHEEVAAALGKTVEATRALQYRAAASLRKMLTGAEF